MDVNRYFEAELNEHQKALSALTASCCENFVSLVHKVTECLSKNGTLFLFGNGGSAADAQHIATELTVRYKKDRKPLSAIALTTDSSALTAIGNDLGYEQVFARQLEALGRSGDIAIGLTTSGRSPSVTAALRTAKSIGLGAAALAGRDGGNLIGIADPLLIVPGSSTARIQEMHILIGHMLCGAVEVALELVSHE